MSVLALLLGHTATLFNPSPSVGLSLCVYTWDREAVWWESGDLSSRVSQATDTQLQAVLGLNFSTWEMRVWLGCWRRAFQNPVSDRGRLRWHLCGHLFHV